MEMHVFEAMAYGHLPPDMKVKGEDCELVSCGLTERVRAENSQSSISASQKGL